MTPLNSIFLIIFGVIAYMMIIDENVSVYFTLIFKLLRVNIERFFWMIRFHPRNPVTNLIKKMEYDRLARELEKEFNVSVQSEESNQSN